MKGAGYEVFVITTMLIILFILISFYTTFANEDARTRDLNYDAAKLTALKDTVLLTNTSLSMTWFVSSVQSMFRTADNSIGCGFDEPSILKQNLGEKYWYQYFPAIDEKSVKPTNPTDDKRLPKTEKYNTADVRPRLCLPQSADIEQYLVEQFKPYMNIQDADGISEEKIKFTASDVTMEISDIRNMFSIAINDASQDSITSTTSEQLVAKNRETTIQNRFSHDNPVYTELPTMVVVGRMFVRYLLQVVSDEMTNIPSTEGGHQIPDQKYNYLTRYQDIASATLAPGNKPTESNDAYLLAKENSMKQFIQQALDASEISNVQFSLLKNKFELVSVTENEKGMQEPRLREDSGKLYSEGVVWHYDVTLKLQEGQSGNFVVPDCKALVPEIANIVAQAVAAQTWSFEGITYTNEEIIPVVEGLINTESGWNPLAVSPCGAAGIAQFIKSTAENNDGSLGDYHLAVPDYGPDQPCHLCKNGAGEVLTVSQCSKCSENICEKENDERFKPEKAVPAAVAHFHKLMEQSREKTEDHENIIKLALASYHSGFGGVTAILNTCGKELWDDVLADPTCTIDDPNLRAYVPIVLFCSNEYGSSISIPGTGTYYYHDEEKNRFFQRPMALEIKAEDWLPVISCREYPYPVGNPNNDLRLFNWEKTNDVACCGTFIWTCNTNIDKLPQYQQLTTRQLIDSSLCSALLGRKPQCTDHGFE
ncbi:MAG: transglycosylase SLT domain-containing protein [Candidatus Aenigmarchaeota archaeon]|nr:transglycosylase SLT domain-containing protein [Candidatus Aenigmarchaeota archaeon]